MKILYFSTPTCGPCRSFYPICKDFFEGKAEFEKIDLSLEENFHFKDEYSLKSVPTLVILDNRGAIVNTIIGSSPNKLKEIEF